MWGKELLYLSIATVVILVIQSLILMYLIVRKYLENQFLLHIEEQKSRLNEPLFSFLLNGEFSRKFKPVTSVQKRAIEELLSRYAEVLEGELEKKNLYRMADFYLKDYYQERLQSRKWSKRMNALYYIEAFKIQSLSKDVRDLIELRNATKDERVRGLRVFSQFEDDQLYEDLVLKHTELSEFEYRSILFVANSNTLDGFVIKFHRCSLALKLAIIDIIGIKNELKYVPFIEAVFQSDSDEVKIRALKALASIGYVEDISEYMPLCKSSKWQERMMMAKLLEAIQEESGLNCLVDLLHDSSWYVRSQAAQAIKSYPNGTRILNEVFETSSDHFAKDMAWEWINKGDE